jgi:hypothetical protein
VGDVSDWAKNQGLLTDTADDVAADIEGVLNTYQTAGPVGLAALAAAVILQGLGVLGSDDIKKKNDVLVTLFGYLFEVLEGDFNVWRMDQVGTEYDHLLTQLQHLDEHFGDLNYLKANSFDLDNNSLDPLNQLADYKSWVRPLYPQAVYNDVFSGKLEPPGSHGPGSIVFDYRLTLSAFLYALAARMTILWALAQVDPRYQDVAKTEASGYASTLLDRYAQMWAGIAIIRAVTLQELQQCIAAATPAIPAPFSAVSFWYLADRPYGAVDTYSTVAVIGQFPPDQIPYLNTNDSPDVLQETYNKFWFRQWIGTLARWKRVYRLMGLPNVKAIINHLKAIAGESPVPPTRPDIGDWSVLETEQATPESIYPRHGALVLQLSVRDWLIKSFDGSVLTGAPILGKTSISVRRTLENFAGLQ